MSDRGGGFGNFEDLLFVLSPFQLIPRLAAIKSHIAARHGSIFNYDYSLLKMFALCSLELHAPQYSDECFVFIAFHQRLPLTMLNLLHHAPLLLFSASIRQIEI
jgi:hypothetical protein